MNEEIIARAGEIAASKTGGGNEGYCVLALIDNVYVKNRADIK